MRRVVLLAAGVALAGTPACENTCAIPGCPAENLVIETRSRCWPDGSYELRGTLDGEAFEVAFALPGAGAASSTDGRVTVRSSDARGVEAIAIVGTPATVELQLFHDGVGVAARTFGAIRYEDREAGGGDCEPTNCGPGAEETYLLEESAVAALCRVGPGDGAP